MFEQEYHTLCLGDEMPEISFHPESSLQIPEDDFAINPDGSFKSWSLDNTLEELNRDPSFISPHRIADDKISEQHSICREDEKNRKTDADQNKAILSEHHTMEKSNIDDTMEFVYPICNKKATSFTKFATYVQTHSRKLQCNICSKAFANRSHLRLHVQRHMKIRLHHCQECTFTCTDKHDLICHISRHKNERKFECVLCKKKFFRRIELNYHKKCVHLRNDIKQCKLCNFSTHSRNILIYHNIRKHQARKRFQCPKCQVSVQHKHSLMLHIRIHSGEKPFSCIKCKKSFKSKSELTSHFKLHEISSIKCTVCKQNFSKKSNLLQHMIVHSEEKCYSCSLCSYKSFWKSTLTRHIKTIHKTATSVAAKRSNTVSEQQLNHEESTTPLEIPVHNSKIEQSAHDDTSSENLTSFCNENKFLIPTELNHQIHSCALCNNTFKRKSELNSHMYVHKKQSFECKVCSRKFKTKSNLNRHSYCHTGLKTYSCKFCSYASNLKTSVTRHMYSMHSTEKTVEQSNVLVTK